MPIVNNFHSRSYPSKHVPHYLSSDGTDFSLDTFVFFNLNLMQFLVTSQKAIEIISVLTLFKPFGGLVWAATCAMIASQTTFLVIIRRVVNSFQTSEKFGTDFKGMLDY